MTVVDPLLQKTDQSAHVPFEHEFKVGSMPLHGRDKRLRTRVDRTSLGWLLVFVYRSVTQLTYVENATSVKERDEWRYVAGLLEST